MNDKRDDGVTADTDRDRKVRPSKSSPIDLGKTRRGNISLAKADDHSVSSDEAGGAGIPIDKQGGPLEANTPYPPTAEVPPLAETRNASGAQSGYAARPTSPADRLPTGESIGERHETADTPRKGRGRTGLIIGGVLAGLAIIAVLTGVLLSQPKPVTTAATRTPAPVTATSVAGDAAPTAPATQSPAVTSAQPTETPAAAQQPDQAEALAMLEAEAKTGLTTIPWQNRYAARLSSKTVGISDQLQTAANGTHSFYESDILAEYLALKERFANEQVFLLKTTDYGGRALLDGKPLFRTMLLDDSFTSLDVVSAWCRTAFPGVTDEVLTNSCIPVQLTS